MTRQERPKPAQTLELGPVRKNRVGVDRNTIALASPFSDAVEVLEREAQRIHSPVTGRTSRIVPVLFHALTDRPGLSVLARLLQGRNIGGRRGRRRTEQI